MLSTPPSSRSSSTSSFGSSSFKDLSETAKVILHSLCHERDFTTAAQLVSPSVIVQHEDNPPFVSRDAYFKGWTQKLQRTPSFNLQIKEACVDEVQRKVWVRSEISGLPNGIRKESIDMMCFDEDGLLSSTTDCQRIIRLRDGDDD